MKTTITDRIQFDLTQIQDSEWLIGIDEVGWGTIAGDLCIGAVLIHKDLLNHFPDDKTLAKIRDSKKLSEKVRKEIEIEVLSRDFKGLLFHTIGQSSVSYINEHGLALAYDECLRQIFDFVSSKIPVNKARLLLDGSRIPGFLKTSSIEKSIVVKGDDLSLVIGLASILAKEFRDNLMNSIDLEFPSFGWVDNKGYGTANHIAALKKYGMTKYHRIKGTTTILS